MPHTIVYDPESNIIITTFIGKININYAKQITTEFALMAREKNCTLFLHDLRQATIEFSTVELHKAPKLISEIFASAGLRASLSRRAVVVAQESEDFKFLENVTFNQGQKNKIFTDMDEARNWLLE